MEMYLFQVACAALGMLLGYLAWSNFALHKRCKAAEDRLAGLEMWATGASPILLGLVGLTGLQGADIETAQKETKH